jgi:hypothetical protein
MFFYWQKKKTLYVPLSVNKALLYLQVIKTSFLLAKGKFLLAKGNRIKGLRGPKKICTSTNLLQALLVFQDSPNHCPFANKNEVFITKQGVNKAKLYLLAKQACSKIKLCFIQQRQVIKTFSLC